MTQMIVLGKENLVLLGSTKEDAINNNRRQDIVNHAHTLRFHVGAPVWF